MADKDKTPGIEGWLWKRGAATGSHHFKSWKRRYFVYKQGWTEIKYYSKPPEPGKEDKVLKGVIAREGLSLGDITNETTMYGRQNCFKLVPSGKESKHYIISSETPSGKEAWLNFMGLPRLSKEVIARAQAKEEDTASESDNAAHVKVTTEGAATTCEGWLWKRGSATGAHHAHNWKKRWFMFKDNKLSYYTKKPAPGQEPKLFKGYMDRDGMTLGEVPGTKVVCGKTHVFKLIPSNGKHYLISAETEEDKEKWLSIMRFPRGSNKPSAPEDDLFEDDVEYVNSDNEEGIDDIFEGWMYKRAALGDGKYTPWKRRWFILKGNILYYYTRRPDSESREKKLLRGSVDTDMATMASVGDDVKIFGRVHAFKLVPKTGRQYILACDTTDEKDAWVKRLSLKSAADQSIDGTLDGEAAKAGDDDDVSGDEMVPAEGYMWKRGATSGAHKKIRWSYRYFKFDAGKLYMYIRKPTTPENEKKYLQSVLEIPNSRLGEVPDDALVYGKCHCFKMMPAGKKHYLMAANSYEEKEMWLSAFKLPRADPNRVAAVVVPQSYSKTDEDAKEHGSDSGESSDSEKIEEK